MKKTDIIFVVPPFTYANYGSIASKCPNLGIALIAACCEREGYTVKIIDAFALDLTHAQIQEYIKQQAPSIVFTGSVTATHKTALQILEQAKELDNNIITVIGGPHPSNAPESCFPMADYVVLNEGEETTVELVNYLLKHTNNNLNSIKGLAFISNNIVIKTEKRSFIKNLDALPLPAYHLLPMDAYKSYGWLDLGRKFSSMITSRGCPFRCSFCASSKNFEHLWRSRSAKHVFEEMRLLYEKYNIRHIYFQDDEFCVNPLRVKELCKLIKEYNMDIYWECLARVVSVNDDLLREMASAGCKSIVYGIEVGYEDGWKKLGKPINKDMCRKAIALTKKHGIIVKASFVTGFPWESAHEIKQTIRFAKELNPEIAFFSTLVPYVGSYIYDQYFKNDRSLYVDPNTNTNDQLFHGSSFTIRTQYLTAKELEYWNGKAYLEFYLRPRYIFMRIKSIKNMQDFTRNLRSGKDILEVAVRRIFKKSAQ